MSESSIDELAALMFAAPLSDLTVAGFTRPVGDAVQFHPALLDLYLHFGRETMIRCTSISGYDRLRCRPVSGRAYPPEIPDGGEPAFSSIADIRLKPAYSTPLVQGFRYVPVNAADSATGVVRCAALLLEGDDVLFLDPMNVFGIRAGDDTDYRRWVDEFAARESLREVSLYPDGSRQERDLP